MVVLEEGSVRCDGGGEGYGLHFDDGMYGVFQRLVGIVWNC